MLKRTEPLRTGQRRPKKKTLKSSTQEYNSAIKMSNNKKELGARRGEKRKKKKSHKRMNKNLRRERSKDLMGSI